MRFQSIGILAVCALALACGSWSSNDEEGVQRIPVRVENDLINRSDVTIRMVGSGGATTVLGGAAPSSDRLFEFRDRILSGSYRLTARTADGRTIESRRFTLFPGAAVFWRLQRNELRVVTADAMRDQDGGTAFNEHPRPGAVATTGLAR